VSIPWAFCPSAIAWPELVERPAQVGIFRDPCFSYLPPPPTRRLRTRGPPVWMRPSGGYEKRNLNVDEYNSVILPRDSPLEGSLKCGWSSWHCCVFPEGLPFLFCPPVSTLSSPYRNTWGTLDRRSRNLHRQPPPNFFFFAFLGIPKFGDFFPDSPPLFPSFSDLNRPAVSSDTFRTLLLGRNGYLFGPRGRPDRPIFNRKGTPHQSLPLKH